MIIQKRAHHQVKKYEPKKKRAKLETNKLIFPRIQKGLFLKVKKNYHHGNYMHVAWLNMPLKILASTLLRKIYKIQFWRLHIHLKI